MQSKLVLAWWKQNFLLHQKYTISSHFLAATTTVQSKFMLCLKMFFFLQDATQQLFCIGFFGFLNASCSRILSREIFQFLLAICGHMGEGAAVATSLHFVKLEHMKCENCEATYFNFSYLLSHIL